MAESASDKYFWYTFCLGWNGGEMGGDVSQPYLKWCLHSPTGTNWWCRVYHQRVSFCFSLFNFLSSSFLFVCKFLQSYFCVLRPLQIVLLTSNCGAGRREITKFGEGRVWGISVEAPFFPLCLSLWLKLN